jgi:hypothetical protein
MLALLCKEKRESAVVYIARSYSAFWHDLTPILGLTTAYIDSSILIK